MADWTTEELEFLHEHSNSRAIDAFVSYQSVFPQSNRTYGSIQKKLKQMKDAALHQFAEEDEDFEVFVPDFSNLSNTVQNGDIQSRVNPASRRADMNARIQADRLAYGEFVQDLISASEENREVLARHATPIPEGDESYLIVLSDTHCGKHTRFFDASVFTQRILSLPQKALDAGWDPEEVTEIVVALVGDMIEGEDIYSTQSHHIEMPVIDQVQIATRTFWHLGLSLRETFPKAVIRFETCPGNHGRVSKTANGKSNWDNVIYQSLGLISVAVNDPNLIVNVNMRDFHTFSIQDKTGLLYHHGTKHTGTAAMQTKIAGWLQTKHFDFLCHGHWHHYEIGTQYGRPIVKNGSLCGEDDLSEKMGVYDPPRQGWMKVTRGSPEFNFGYFQWEQRELD